MVVAVTKDGENYPVNVSWTDDSVDDHTGVFTLTQNGDYVVTVRYADKAGNPMANYTSRQMTLDTVAPEIKVTNIKANSANKDEVYGFQIQISDTNLDAATMQPVLTAVLKGEDGSYSTQQIDLGDPTTVIAGSSYTYTVENLPEDALYTLSCQVSDMSRNSTAQVVLEDEQSYETVSFSVNRKGSAFGFGNDTSAGVVDQYYVYSVDQDVVLVEVNADPVEIYSITLNGETLVEGQDYTTAQISKAGEWSKRTYTISKDLFTEEGQYNLVVSSTDKTETVSFSDVKDLMVAFVVDQTAPEIVISGMEAGGRYQTVEQTVTMRPNDEVGRINSLKVLLLTSSNQPMKDDAGNDISVRFDKSGEALQTYLEENDGVVTFVIPEVLNARVQIICDDCAVNANGEANVYDKGFERITVSDNRLVIFYADTYAFVGTILGVVALTILIIVLVKRKKSNGSKKAKTKA